MGREIMKLNIRKRTIYMRVPRLSSYVLSVSFFSLADKPPKRNIQAVVAVEKVPEN
jgi:hypothetical protein